MTNDDELSKAMEWLYGEPTIYENPELLERQK